MEPQQSDLYAKYVQKLGWQVEKLDGVQIFIKRIPLTGAIAKIHRPQKLPNATKLKRFLVTHRIRTLAVEPVHTIAQKEFTKWIQPIARVVHINQSPFLPTKTDLVDLTPSEEQIFNTFSEAKRRAVRRAIKLGVVVKESDNINELMRVKNTSAGLFGFITTYGIKHLWDLFAPKHATILLAYSSDESKLIGGVLLLFWKGTAYYWIAGATKPGKKLFAPTLLVWEALKLSKARNKKLFDFVGVWDERLPHENTQWHGFTKFKEGFGGKNRYYPIIRLL